tara:strand:- start:688 stop:858 length:171 start_codon:yes stop_codon:yes gene_type:complete
MGPGFFMFFQVPSIPSGSGGRATTTSLFKSEYTLESINQDDDDILAIIMAFMFTRK